MIYAASLGTACKNSQGEKAFSVHVDKILTQMVLDP